MVSQISSTRIIRSGMLSFFACSVNSLCMAALYQSYDSRRTAARLEKAAAHDADKPNSTVGTFVGVFDGLMVIRRPPARRTTVDRLQSATIKRSLSEKVPLGTKS